MKGSLCNLCALAAWAGVTYIFATQYWWVSRRTKQLSTVAILLYRFLLCLVSKRLSRSISLAVHCLHRHRLGTGELICQIKFNYGIISSTFMSKRVAAQTKARLFASWPWEYFSISCQFWPIFARPRGGTRTGENLRAAGPLERRLKLKRTRHEVAIFNCSSFII